MVLRARHTPAIFDQASRSLIQTDLANNNRVELSCQDHDPGLGTPTAAETFSTVQQWTHLQQSATTPVQVSDSGATSTGGRCSVSWLAGEISVHVATVLLAPVCPERALRYYHRFLAEHPELREGRRRY